MSKDPFDITEASARVMEGHNNKKQEGINDFLEEMDTLIELNRDRINALQTHSCSAELRLALKLSEQLSFYRKSVEGGMLDPAHARRIIYYVLKHEHGEAVPPRAA